VRRLHRVQDPPPTQRFVTACVETYPQLEWLGGFNEESQLWGDGAIPRWFENWLKAEREATTLWIWRPPSSPACSRRPTTPGRCSSADC
jgi:hypothetical protein